MSFTAKCLPVTFALSADKYLAASCCLEGAGGSQSRLGVFGNFGKVGVNFPSRLTSRMRSLDAALGGRRGFKQFALQSLCGLTPGHHWVILRTPILRFLSAGGHLVVSDIFLPFSTV